MYITVSCIILWKPVECTSSIIQITLKHCIHLCSFLDLTLPVSVSHTKRVPSDEPAATYWPSGLGTNRTEHAHMQHRASYISYHISYMHMHSHVTINGQCLLASSGIPKASSGPVHADMEPTSTAEDAARGIRRQGGEEEREVERGGERNFQEKHKQTLKLQATTHTTLNHACHLKLCHTWKC